MSILRLVLLSSILNLILCSAIDFVYIFWRTEYYRGFDNACRFINAAYHTLPCQYLLEAAQQHRLHAQWRYLR